MSEQHDEYDAVAMRREAAEPQPPDLDHDDAVVAWADFRGGRSIYLMDYLGNGNLDIDEFRLDQQHGNIGLTREEVAWLRVELGKWMERQK